MYRGHFFLTVWGELGVQESWFPEDPIEYRNWDGAIRENIELGPYSEDQPIPYIADMSQKGVMVIGWDRQMSTPQNYTRIPTA